MASNPIRIDPLDLKSSTGVGVGLPFNGPGVFNTNYTTKEQLRSNLINLVLTEPGERMYKPFFGVGLNSLLFEQKISSDDIKNKIQEACAQDGSLNKITISNVEVNQDLNSNTVFINVEYIINLDSSTDAIGISIGGINERGPAPYETKENNY